MWISKKKWGALKKRVADLESQLAIDPEAVGKAIKDTQKRFKARPFRKVSSDAATWGRIERTETEASTGNIIREIYTPDGRLEQRTVLRDLNTVSTEELIEELSRRQGIKFV